MRADTAALDQVLGMFSSVTDEVTFTPGPDGTSISARSLDSVSMLAAVLYPQTMEVPDGAFTCKLSDLRKALKGPEAEITLEDNRVLIRTGKVTSRISRYSDAASTRVPDLEMHAEAMLSAEDIRSLMSGRTEDEAAIRVAEDGLHISLGDDMGNGISLDIPAADMTLVSGEARSVYPMHHLGAFVRCLPKGVDIDIALRDDFPMRVSVVTPGWKAQYLIAPRISQE